MPSSMTHLLCAYHLMPKMPSLFCIGCVAPDCIDIREIKDKEHLRLLPSEERLSILKARIKKANKGDLFYLGTVYHLYADYMWDIGPQRQHKDAYTGQSWFIDYRREIRLAGLEIYQQYSWCHGLFDRLLSVPSKEYSSIADYPPDKIREFIENSMKKTIDGAKEAQKSFFTPKTVSDFAKATADGFKALLQ